jgi:tetratricopeptide (TPR) repeat protein
LAKPKIAIKDVPDPATMSASTTLEYNLRGWLFYSHQNYEKAVSDFRRVLEKNNNEVDAWYGLGLSLKFAGSSTEAVDAFNKVLGLIKTMEDKQRKNVLERLAKGQVNQIQTGDWDLEKEVWKRS